MLAIDRAEQQHASILVVLYYKCCSAAVAAASRQKWMNEFIYTMWPGSWRAKASIQNTWNSPKTSRMFDGTFCEQEMLAKNETIFCVCILSSYMYVKPLNTKIKLFVQGKKIAIMNYYWKIILKKKVGYYVAKNLWGI